MVLKIHKVQLQNCETVKAQMNTLKKEKRQLFICSLSAGGANRYLFANNLATLYVLCQCCVLSLFLLPQNGLMDWPNVLMEFFELKCSHAICLNYSELPAVALHASICPDLPPPPLQKNFFFFNVSTVVKNQ